MPNIRPNIRPLVYALTVICSLLLMHVLSRYAHAENPGVELMAVQTPPMAMEDGQEPGAVLELVMAATERAGLRPKVTFIPWRRAQEMVTGGKDMLIAPLTWLPSRADRYTWIAPLCRMERSIASLRYRIDSLEQARRERRTLVVGAGSAQDQQLQIGRAHV